MLVLSLKMVRGEAGGGNRRSSTLEEVLFNTGEENPTPLVGLAPPENKDQAPYVNVPWHNIPFVFQGLLGMRSYTLVAYRNPRVARTTGSS